MAFLINKLKRQNVLLVVMILRATVYKSLVENIYQQLDTRYLNLTQYWDSNPLSSDHKGYDFANCATDLTYIGLFGWYGCRIKEEHAPVTAGVKEIWCYEFVWGSVNFRVARKIISLFGVVRGTVNLGELIRGRVEFEIVWETVDCRVL